MEQQTGKVHIYCGDGKGKTTTAVGLIIRCAGAGKRVLLYQFMKNNSSSERKILETIPNIVCEKGAETAKFSFQMTEEEKVQAKKENDAMLQSLFEQARQYDVLFLDEALYAIRAGLLSETLFIQCLQEKQPDLEVIVTGRDPSDAVIEMADYVSEIKKIKHPFDQGLNGRLGIEY